MSETAVQAIQDKIQEIDRLIQGVLDSNFLSDKVYTAIVTQIGRVDEMSLKSQHLDEDPGHTQALVKRLDGLCQILLKAKKIHADSPEIQKEIKSNIMGDSYNEDNSIVLTPELKAELRKFLNEK